MPLKAMQAVHEIIHSRPIQVSFEKGSVSPIEGVKGNKLYQARLKIKTLETETKGKQKIPLAFHPQLQSALEKILKEQRNRVELESKVSELKWAGPSQISPRSFIVEVKTPREEEMRGILELFALNKHLKAFKLK